MPLVDRLEASFSEGGFDLTTAFDGVRGAIGAVDIAAPAIDRGGIDRARQLLNDFDLGGFGDSVAAVAAQAGAELDRLPLGQELLAPIEAALAAVQVATPERIAQLRAALETAERIGSGRGPGLAGLQDAIGELASLPQAPGVADILDLARGLLPVPLSIDDAAGTVGTYGAGAVALVTKVGALMALRTVAREIENQARLTAQQLNAEAARNAALRLQGMAGEGGLGRLLDGVDPGDAAAAAALAGPLRAFAAAVDDLADAAIRGLAFGEATLVHAGLDRRAEQLELASRALTSAGTAPVRAMVADIMERLQPVLAIRLGDPAASLEAFWGEATGIVDELAQAIRNFDTAILTGPITAGIESATDGLAQVARAVEEAAAAIRNAIAAVRGAIGALNLGQIAEALHEAMRPVVEAVAELERLVAAAQAEIERVAAEITAAVDAVRAAAGTAADQIQAAFDRLNAAMTAVDVQRLVDEVRDGVRAVADALQAIQLQPYFDAAIDVIDTGADLLDAVPFDILPDDARRELEETARPIKAIDFQADVADVLKARLDTIVTGLDTEVLTELEAAYADAVAFLGRVDLRGEVERFEREHFDPLIASISAIDPTEILKPVTEALEEVRGALAGLDPGALLAPVEAAFDALLAQLDALDPAALLAPITAEIEAVRAQIADAILLDEWEPRIDEIRDLALAQVDRLDIAAIVPPLARGFDALVAEAGAGLELVNLPGTAVALLAQGLRLPVDSGAFADVSAWIGGEDGAAALRSSLGSAASALEDTRDAVRGLDLAAAVAAAQPVYRSLTTALTAMPETSPVRARLAPLLAGASPLDRLAGTAEGAARYAGRLDAAAGRLRELEGSGWSEVRAASEDLRDALRPLAAVPQFLRGLFGRVGLDPGGKPLSGLLVDLFAFLHPERSLQPLLPVEAAVKLKAREALDDGIARPLKEGAVAIRSLIDAVDLEPVRAELAALHAQVRDEVEAFRPSLLLGDVLAGFEAAKATIVAFDPLGPAAAAIATMRDALADLIGNFRPSQRLAGVFALYDQVVAAAGVLDIRSVLEPILTALQEIEAQLDSGLDDTAAALKRLQGALP